MCTQSVRMGCSFPTGCWIGKLSNMFDILPTLFQPWLHLPGKCPFVYLYGLSDTLPALSCNVTFCLEALASL